MLVSEVMLQQTPVGRVLGRWERFLQRWPDPGSCAAAPLEAVLREWQGLGYPRRARSLWLVAAQVDQHGWPIDERALRSLPGVGPYTAKALLAFSDVPGAAPALLPPRDINAARVAARAVLGREPHQATATALDEVLAAGRPARVSVRDWGWMLLDVGAAHCRAVPRCAACPLQGSCAARPRPGQGVAGRPVSPPRQPPYRGSLRQLRGAVLAHALQGGALDAEKLAARLQRVPGATPQRIGEAIAGLAAEGLLSRGPPLEPLPPCGRQRG